MTELTGLKDSTNWTKMRLSTLIDIGSHSITQAGLELAFLSPSTGWVGWQAHATQPHLNSFKCIKLERIGRLKEKCFCPTWNPRKF